MICASLNSITDFIFICHCCCKIEPVQIFGFSQTIYYTRTLTTKIKSGRKMGKYNRGAIAVAQ